MVKATFHKIYGIKNFMLEPQKSKQKTQLYFRDIFESFKKIY